jgi:hypothetical protein
MSLLKKTFRGFTGRVGAQGNTVKLMSFRRFEASVTQKYEAYGLVARLIWKYNDRHRRT